MEEITNTQSPEVDQLNFSSLSLTNTAYDTTPFPSFTAINTRSLEPTNPVPSTQSSEVYQLDLSSLSITDDNVDIINPPTYFFIYCRHAVGSILPPGVSLWRKPHAADTPPSEPTSQPARLWQRPETPTQEDEDEDDETIYLTRYCTNCCNKKLQHWQDLLEMYGPFHEGEPELQEVLEIVRELEVNVAHNATLGC